ncbi:MAG: hypothetical protein CUN56_01045 [Phototrophicales bacterium]|nr:MAG: hypothetical protein CUN56_01045 [Phototrophicales bacterium]RMG77574.1 MAG: hypothetical protein D6711_01295 [Chloroflexota bacterium]
MRRFLVSLLLGIGLGIGGGIALGWGPLAVVYVDGPASALAQRYRDEYTVMIAAGYRADQDALGAIERLRILGEDNIPLYVQEVTERFITNSRDIDDIYHLVALAEGLGRLTEIMIPFRQVTTP